MEALANPLPREPAGQTHKWPFSGAFPMCYPPDIPVGTVPEEVPTGLAAGAMGATWAVEDTPMLLHTFAYLTRGALLSWWETLVPQGAETQQPPFKVSPYG